MKARTNGTCGICGMEYYPGDDITWNRRTTSPSGERFHVRCFNRARGIAASSSPTSAIVPIPLDDETEEIPESVILPPVKPPSFIADPITANIVVAGKHSATALIVKVLARRRYPFLYGGPGGGKTYLVRSLADDMGLDFVLISCSRDMFRSEILGSRSPLTGDYFSTPFRSAWENGGVVLFDECGVCDGAFLNTLNSALEQKEIRFPDGERIKMHKNCFVLFADNSTLYGNDPLYPERTNVGGAFRDRLTYVQFDYDESLERRILAEIFGDSNRATRWHEAVLTLRRKLTELQLPVFASPRFAYKGAEYLMDGIHFDVVMAMELYRGMTEDVVNQTRPVVASVRGSY